MHSHHGLAQRGINTLHCRHREKAGSWGPEMTVSFSFPSEAGLEGCAPTDPHFRKEGNGLLKAPGTEVWF